MLQAGSQEVYPTSSPRTATTSPWYRIPETSFDIGRCRRDKADARSSRKVHASLCGHSYGGSVVTEAGVDPHVVGTAGLRALPPAPSVGHYEAEDEGKTPSVLDKTKGAVVVTPDGFTFLNPPDFPVLFAPNLPRKQAVFESHSQVKASAKVFHTPLSAAAWETKPSWAIVAGDDKIINPEVEKMWYARAHSHVTVLDGVGHDVYEARPKEVAALIEEAASHAR